MGDFLFLLLLIHFVVRMARRFLAAAELPPPGFVLVGFGLWSAVVGLGLLMAGWSGWIPGLAMGGMLLNQAFVLFLVLGVGSFLLPRFLNMPSNPSFDSMAGWRKHALFATGVGFVLLATYFGEAFGVPARIAAVVRFAAAAAYFMGEVPFQRGAIPKVTLAQSIRLAMVLLLTGLLCQAIWPEQRLAALHVLFIGGFGLVTFSVATRVILGHAGLGRLFHTRLWFVIVMAAAFTVAAALRFLGDFIPMQRATILNGAAYLWIIGAIVWASQTLSKVRITDTEDEC